MNLQQFQVFNPFGPASHANPIVAPGQQWDGGAAGAILGGIAGAALGNASYGGPTFGQMLLAIATISAITLALPPRWALLFPAAILLGYTAKHKDSVAAFFNSVDASLQTATTVARSI